MDATKLYYRQLIQFPYTERDYHTVSFSSLVDIPPIRVRDLTIEHDDMSQRDLLLYRPLARKSYPFKASTALLYLYNKKIVTAYNAKEVNASILHFFDEDMELIPEHAMAFKKLIHAYDDYCERHDITVPFYFKDVAFHETHRTKAPDESIVYTLENANVKERKRFIKAHVRENHSLFEDFTQRSAADMNAALEDFITFRKGLVEQSQAMTKHLSSATTSLNETLALLGQMR